MNQVGSSNPKYREQIRNRVDATTSYSKPWSNIEVRSNADLTLLFKYDRMDGKGPFVAQAYVRSLGPWAYASLSDIPAAPNTAYYSEARNKALQYLYQRHAAVTHSLQGGVFIGELRQTINMIRHPLEGLKRGLLGYMDDVQHRLAANAGYLQRIPKKRRTKWVNDAIADTWLSWSLGWKPLLVDIENAFQALTNIASKSQSFGLTATGSAEGLVSTNTVRAMANNYLYTFINKRVVARTSVRFKAGFTLTPPQVAEYSSAASQLGLTFADFIPTVWNLIPGSFLLDYVTNIGDVIDAVSHPLVGLTYIAESIKHETTTDWDVIPDAAYVKSLLGSNYVAYGGSGGSATAVTGAFIRQKPTTLLPSFQVDLDLSDTQLLNVAALMQKGNLVSLATLGAIKKGPF